jgi:hypothetical protein
MKLSDIFSLLSTGEFSNLYMGGDANDGIPTAEYPTVVNHINLALTDLHTRFPLKEKEVIIQQYENITMYKLHSDYAESNTSSTKDPKYIKDSADSPFLDDILRIERAYKENGDEVSLNDYGVANSWYTPSWDTLQIPFPVSTNTANLIFRATHPVLVGTTEIVPTTVEVDLPYSFVNALLMFVASRQFAGKPNQDTQALSMAYYQKYELACTQLEKYNVANDSDAITNNKLEINGWV